MSQQNTNTSPEVVGTSAAEALVEDYRKANRAFYPAFPETAANTARIACIYLVFSQEQVELAMAAARQRAAELIALPDTRNISPF